MSLVILLLNKENFTKYSQQCSCPMPLMVSESLESHFICFINLFLEKSVEENIYVREKPAKLVQRCLEII
jgi:hypothetical protein